LNDNAVRASETLPTIEETPREIHLILADWRDAERVLNEQAPGTASWESARADVERLREEYARAYQHRRASDRAGDASRA
jgi:hypothetical protein